MPLAEWTWYPTGKDGRGKRLPDRPSASTGPTPLGGAVGRPAVLRHKTPLRIEIGAKMFHGVGRRTAVVIPGARSIHYLDDYITMGPPMSVTCGRNLELMLDSCRRLGVPVAPAKCVGPSCFLVSRMHWW